VRAFTLFWCLWFSVHCKCCLLFIHYLCTVIPVAFWCAISPSLWQFVCLQMVYISINDDHLMACCLLKHCIGDLFSLSISSNVISPVFLANALVIAVANCIRIVCIWCGVEVAQLRYEVPTGIDSHSFVTLSALRHCNSLPIHSPSFAPKKRRYNNWLSFYLPLYFI